jgi:hypothetical protein
MQEKFHVDKRIYCQYTSTSETFEMGFQKVESLYPGTTFIKEDDFKKTLSRTLEKVDTEYIVFFTDDDVFVKDVDTDWYKQDLGDNHCLSLRMNPSINRCYPAKNKDIKPPMLKRGLEYFRWNWKEAPEQHTCWGYPMAINSHIYRSKDIISLIQRGQYNNVNSLEAWINCNRWHDKPYMLSFTETKVFNVQNNFVQGHRQNEKHVCHYWLNEQFLQGKRISTDNIYGLEPQAAHGVIDYHLEDVCTEK